MRHRRRSRGRGRGRGRVGGGGERRRIQNPRNQPIKAQDKTFTKHQTRHIHKTRRRAGGLILVVCITNSQRDQDVSGGALHLLRGALVSS